MNTMQLACFLTVANTLSFAAAAKQLHVTQPAITQQIHSLETELNVQLFKRTTRSVEITQEGLIFYGDAKAMMDIYERTKKRAENIIVDQREPFIIGCHSNNDIFHLGTTLHQFKKHFPQVYPLFRVVPFEHLFQRLSEEAVDIVLAFKEGELKKGINYQELVKISTIAIMTASHPLSTKNELCCQDLQQAPLVILDPQNSPAEYRQLIHRLLENRPSHDIYFCEAMESAITLAKADYGIAILPNFMLDQDPELCYSSIIDCQPLSYGIYYKNLIGNKLRKTFVQIAKEYLD